MTEQDFARKIRGRILTPAQIAMLRRNYQMPHDETLVPADRDERQALLNAAWEELTDQGRKART